MSLHPFKLIQLPLNVRFEKALRKLPFIRRFAPSIAQIMPKRGVMEYANKHPISFDGSNHQFHAIYEPHYQQWGYEPETTAVIAALLKGDDLFIDAGSNWGYFSLFAATLPDFTGPIISYEPSPRTFQDLQSCVSQAGQQERIRLRQIGLGAWPSELKLHAPEGTPSGLHQLKANGTGASIIVTALDAEAPAKTRLIKIDVEGMELEVLKGAATLIREQKPWLIFENFLQPQDPEQTLAPIRWLKDQGYSIWMPALAYSDENQNSALFPYGTPLPADRQGEHLRFFEVTICRRFLLPNQLNLLACPPEMSAQLPGIVIS